MAKILVVDDETDLEVLIKQKFRKKIRQKEYEFLFAINGVDALEKLLKDPEVDIVLSDINMPEISGLSFAKSINKKIKIIFTTAYREYAIDGFDLKAVDYLLKPISFERLFQSIQKFKNENDNFNQEPLGTIQSEKSNFIFVFFKNLISRGDN